VNVDLLYFDGCPNWHVAHERVTEALRRAGRRDQRVNLVRVSTDDDARALQFPGSPTVRVDGRDLFPGDGGVGLACRVYSTPDGLAGSPTVGQLVDAMASATTAKDAPRPGQQHLHKNPVGYCLDNGTVRE
jgi:hypothetical protein